MQDATGSGSVSMGATIKNKVISHDRKGKARYVDVNTENKDNEEMSVINDDDDEAMVQWLLQLLEQRLTLQ